jgi:hypothetical protein
MIYDDDATKAVKTPRSVVLVSSAEALAARCREICIRARVILIVESDLAALTNTAVERKPLVILFPDHIYAFDSAEFDVGPQRVDGDEQDVPRSQVERVPAHLVPSGSASSGGGGESAAPSSTTWARSGPCVA